MGLLDTMINKIAKNLNSTNRKTAMIKNDLPADERQLIERREMAENLIKNKSLMSSAGAVVPIPGLDVGVDMKLMTDMIEQINRTYGLSHKQVNGMTDDLKQKVMMTAAKQGSELIGRRMSRAVVAALFKTVAKRELAKQSKWVPIVGQAISASVSYYMMKKMGLAHIDKCEKVARALINSTK
ncbi:DUF697 domain-containing protein [Macrococcus equipercicus]|uniref:DUF697 domain-containing protein n=1 Tax=Macrococcus equipercicus TaxID=69967 RepID=A0A9Q9F2L1_9STAP|nr:DUF697 domain-containing protein [Macrococcus equipercicus]KAA1042650.1 DUF697 domain-containing protein [Macrococcus equipercicus]UTH14516.1 DUF697 domain-containing protein [Macrococcus equipercicus]